MALHLNFEGLTYSWYYGPTVIVSDGGIEVDAFSLGYWPEDYSATYADFVRGVVRWSEYIGEAAYYSSENAF